MSIKIKMKNRFLPIIAIFVVWIIFSAPFLFLGKSPFPSDYQTNFFSPWNVYPGYGGPVKNNAQPDIITQIYPWRYFDIQEYKAGRIPFWNPYSFAGTPHLANYQSASLSPLNLIFLLPLRFIDVWSLLVLLQPLLAGLFTYILLRRLSVSKPGSLLSSFSFMFSGFLVTWMGYATLGYAILPLPLAYYCILKYVEYKRYKWLILLSFLFLFSFFSGHFQMSIYFSFGVFAFIIYNIAFVKEKKPYVDALIFSFFGILMAMPQILPSIELYSLSVRSNLFQKVEAIPWKYLPTILSPDFYGNPTTRNDWFGHYAEWSGFAGAIGFFFALATAFFKRNKTTVFFIGLALVSLFLAYDTPLLSFLVYLRIPVLSTSAASRIIVLFSFSIAVLAGFGLDQVLGLYKYHRKKLFIWLGICAVLVLIVVAVPFLHLLDSDKSHIAQKNIILPLMLFGFLAIFVTGLIYIKNKYTKMLFVVLVLFLSAIDMVRFAAKWQSFIPKSKAYISVPIEKFYQKQNHIDRAIGLSGEEDAVYFRMPILSGYDPLYISGYGEFIQYVGSGLYKTPERSVVTFPINGKYTPQAIDFLGVKYIVHKISDGEFAWAFPFKKYPLPQFEKIYDDSYYNVFLNKTAYPRAFIVPSLVRVKKENMVNEMLFAKDLRKVAIVTDAIDGLDPNASGTARIVNYVSNKIDIDVVTTGKSFLVLTDNFYPGWKAYIDGKPAKIYKANYSFRGVVVPKGKSRVEFSYIPQSFLIGTYLFLIGIMGIVISIIIRKFKYQK